ncbi:hypothetical protein RAB80_014402 [Fusarium oxysporum f. sp. vasinfectum]|nr:hypothetical protein RAB80_014629 [Fusarium oxysporum f. sp. vasinfectum]KAK2669171.1 hypothetical protein RAB80_014697 [Fusarium oxysporum f. sp. vasinfectum]KAK2670265.1 hypothetical protein RAB80_014402 [Fusarium oxysporum f. sp. vasinfectum]
MASSQTTAASTPSISDQPITGTSLDFSLFFKATYPDEDTQNTTGGSQSMTCENLAKVECVGNWMREGIIVSKSHGGRGVISSVAVEFSVETEAEDFLD